MDVFSVIIAISLIIVLYYVIERLTEDRVAKLVNKLPGPIKLPLIGTAYLLLISKKEDLFRLADKRIGRYGKIFRSWLGSIPVVHLYHPEHIEVVLNNSIQITKSSMYDPLHPWLGEGLLTSTGTKWHKHRKLITPTFHFKILENFMDVFVDKSKLLVSLLEAKSKTGEVFDMYPFITRCTLDIICETAMGHKINAMQDEDNEYVQSIYELTRITVNRLINPWLHPDFIFYRTSYGRNYRKCVSYLHKFTTQVINERRHELKLRVKESNVNTEDNDVGTKRRQAFLDLFLEMSQDNEGFTDTEIREQVDTFMFEGHDTTTAGIAWSLFLLGNHPEIQDEVYEEIQKVFDQCNGNFTVADLSELKLLERCIKEALRLYPSVPTVGRMLTQDIELGGYTVPAGTAINIHIFLAHRIKENYPEPEHFDPNRFLPENLKNKHAYSYVPFSAGPRNCIGQKFAMYEEKTLLAYILKHYRVKAMETQEAVRPMMELVLRPKNGLQIILEARK